MSWRNWFRAIRRKTLDPFWRNWEWPLVAGLWLAGLILGYIGFARYSAAVGDHAGFWGHLYRDLQLIVLQSGDVAVPGGLPWTLNLARFLVPAVAGYAAIQALLAVFREQWHLVGLRRVKDHAVVCGLGERGLRLARNFLDRGYLVVAVDNDEENPLVEQCRAAGALVLVGDAKDANLLRRARVHRAKYLAAVCPDDGANADIALQARDLVRTRRGAPLNAFVHIVDLELCNALSESELGAGADSFRLEFFNVQERGARLMLNECPPGPRGAGADEKPPRIVIVGLGKMGRSLLVQAARDWWIARAGDGRKMHVVVIDQSAAAKLETLRLQYPQLDRACEFDARQFPKNGPEFERADFLYDGAGRSDVDAVYVCFDDDVHVMVSALALLRKTRGSGAPIAMRMSRTAGLAALLTGGDDSSDFRRLRAFAVLDRTCALDALLGGRREVIARAIHEDYVRRQTEAGLTPSANPSMVGWEELPEDLKESNRQQADHIEVKVKAVGCGIQALTDWAAASFESLPEDVRRVFDVELLARMEHERWDRERRAAGWAYAPGPKDAKKKTSPYLVPWDRLSEDVRDLDRETVRGLPAFLARAGFQIYRKD